MTRKHVALIAGALVALGLSFAAGRLSRPERVVTRTQTVTVEKRIEVTRAEATTEKTADVEHAAQWRERVVYRPGGVTIVTREVAKRDEARADVRASSVSEHAMTQESARETTRERIVESKPASWSLGATAGMGLDGRLRYGAEIGRRFVGPAWLSVGVDVPSRAATVGIRVQW